MTIAEARTSDTASRAERHRSRTYLTRIALVLVAGCSLALLYPALVAPLTADDQFFYLWSAAWADQSFPELLGTMWDRFQQRLEWGRVNMLTEFERRGAGMLLTDLAVATATPIHVGLAVMKLALILGGVACVLAFLRSLRWRSADGELTRLSRRTLALAGVAGLLAVAVGTQAHRAFSNGWTAYPVSTYGAIITLFGSVALVLWLTRLLAARPSRRMRIGIVAVLMVLGLTTALRYELLFPAVPIALVTLLLVPITSRDQQEAGRRAKWTAAAAYGGTFFPVLVASRIYLAEVCAEGECYSGVSMSLGWNAVRTLIFNVLSAIPGFSGNERRDELASIGLEQLYPAGLTWWSVLLGLAVLAALVAIWWSRRPANAGDAPTVGTSSAAAPDGRAQVMLLLVGAGVSLAIAVACAAVMAISGRSQGVVSAPGTPFRQAVVTWTGLAFCLVLLVLAAASRWRGRPAIAAWTGLALVLAIAAAVTLPNNLTALRVARVQHVVSDAINWEVVLGDPTQAGDDRRCALYDRIDVDIDPYARPHMKTHSNTAFEAYHDRPFCSRATVE